MDNKLPIVVFDLTGHGNIWRAVTGSGDLGTLVGASETSWA
jgi:uridylate kinase